MVVMIGKLINEKNAKRIAGKRKKTADNSFLGNLRERGPGS